jgi:hypothetical protein
MTEEVSDVPQKRRTNRLVVFAIVLILILLFVLLLDYVLTPSNPGYFNNIINTL